MLKCKVCDSKKLKTLLELPQLPLSETYGEFDENFSSYDQAIDICQACSHVQLAFQIPPKLLYNESDYKFSTSRSLTTPKRFTSFRRFVDSTINGKYNTVADIGGNDTSLLDLFDSPNKLLIDPSVPKNIEVDGVTVIRDFIENINLGAFSPDIILCSHTLEHIANPADFIDTLLKQCDDDTLFFFEVPCFEKQVNKLRFDAFFHQHFHYFHPSSLSKLIDNCDGEIIAMKYNDHPTCGGAVMFAFRRKFNRTALQIYSQVKYENKAYQVYENLFHEAYDRFRKMNIDIANWIREKPKVYGYGASLLLPIVFYHIGDTSRNIEIVFDDDLTKTNFGYKNIPNVRVGSPLQFDLKPDEGILITSYENILALNTMIKLRFNVSTFEGFPV